MKAAKSKIEDRVEHFKDECRNAGLRLTHQRLEIFRGVVESGDHPDAEGVYQRVRKRLPTVSLDTVYRTLWMLKDRGLITTFSTSHSSTRFDGNLERHHHFVCQSCGETSDFYSEEFDYLEVPKDVLALGKVETTQVEVRGFCNKCSQKKRVTDGR